MTPLAIIIGAVIIAATIEQVGKTIVVAIKELRK